MESDSPTSVTPKDSLLAPVAIEERGVRLTNLEDAWRFAKMVISSGAAPKGVNRPEQVMIAIQAGAELGFTPLHSLSNIPVINGRPSVMGDAALALVRQSGLMEGGLGTEYSGEGDEYGCSVTSRRVNDAEATTHRFTVKDAKSPKLWGKPGPWSDYPQRMLYYRALGFHLRDLYSDVLAGLSIAEEVRDYPASAIPRGAQEPPKEADPLLALEPGAEPEPVPEPAPEPVEAEVVDDTPKQRPYQSEEPPSWFDDAS